MIIKTFYKIKIHFLTYIVALICALTSHFSEFIFISLIIIIHEFGHIIFLIIYKWNIEKIIFLPFGGVTIIKDNLNKPLKEEFIITIMGPIFQMIGFLLLKEYFNNSFYLYLNMSILIFNLIPILPLDGAKILNIILNVFCPFKKSHLTSIVLSIIFLIIFIVSFKFNLIIILIMIFLLFKVIDEYKNHEYYFNKFILERLMYKFKFKKINIIKSNNINKMYKDKRHLFLSDNNYITEKVFLSKKFDFKGKV